LRCRTQASASSTPNPNHTWRGSGIALMALHSVTIGAWKTCSGVHGGHNNVARSAGRPMLLAVEPGFIAGLTTPTCYYQQSNTWHARTASKNHLRHSTGVHLLHAVLLLQLDQTHQSPAEQAHVQQHHTSARWSDRSRQFFLITLIAPNTLLLQAASAG
jgi:hypothetical protein